MTSFLLLIVSISVDVHFFVSIFSSSSSSYSNKLTKVISVACVPAAELAFRGFVIFESPL